MIVRPLGAFWACEQGTRVTRTKLATVRNVNSLFTVISDSLKTKLFIAYSLCENKEMGPLEYELIQDKTPQIFGNSWSEALRPCLPTPVPTAGGAGRHRVGLPGNVDMIIGSALTPVLESVTALPASR